MKPSPSRRLLLQSIGSALLGGTALHAGAQRPGVLKLIVGTAAGGALDQVARLLSRSINGFDAVVVENRVGASGRIAMDVVARARPDGRTLLVSPDFCFTVSPHVYRKLTPNPDELLPVARCVTSEYALCVGPAVPAQVDTVAEFFGWCRRNPALAVFGSPSPGSTAHFVGLELARMANVNLVHVPYRGGAPALQDLLAGQLSATVSPVPEILPHLKASKVRVLATSGTKRSIPAVPTFAEAGFPEHAIQSWIGIFAPPATPVSTLTSFEAAIGEALKSAPVAEGLTDIGFNVSFAPRQRLAALVQEDRKRWGPIVKASGFTIEE